MSERPEFSNIRMGIVVSRFNSEMTDDLLRGARNALLQHGMVESQLDVLHVPGAWEIPLALQRMARSGRYAALISLGVVIRGQTTHDRHINRFVSLAIGQLSLRFDLPIAFGVLTCKTVKQAQRRASPEERNKGAEIAAAAIEMLQALRSIQPASTEERDVDR